MEKIPRIEINGARIPLVNGPVIDRIPPPVVDRPELPRLTIPKPVVDVPRPSLDYPTILVPPSVGAPSPQRPSEAPREAAAATRNLPKAPPVIPPAPQPNPPTPPVQGVPAVRADVNQVIEIAGVEVKIPKTEEIVQASATAVVGTSVTLATAMVFNQARRVMGEAVTKAAREKFKIKLRTVKPVIHMIYEEGGITVMEYSGEGVRTLATDVQDPEQYLRDTIEADELYEADHKIVIDEPIREKFSREGAKRFSYFAPPKKLARRLAARIALG